MSLETSLGQFCSPILDNLFFFFYYFHFKPASGIVGHLQPLIKFGIRGKNLNFKRSKSAGRLKRNQDMTVHLYVCTYACAPYRTQRVAQAFLCLFRPYPRPWLWHHAILRPLSLVVAGPMPPIHLILQRQLLIYNRDSLSFSIFR